MSMLRSLDSSCELAVPELFAVERKNCIYFKNCLASYSSVGCELLVARD
jgi:hypothetical protein